METILVIDNDTDFRNLAVTALGGGDHAVETAGSVAEGIQTGERTAFRLVIAGATLAEDDALTAVRWWRGHSPETPVIVIAGAATVASAVEAMRSGAADYLAGPVSDAEELRGIVEKTLDKQYPVAPAPVNGAGGTMLLKGMERQAILSALDANGGNRTRTAKQLGISLRTLQYRLKEYRAAGE